LRLDPNYARAQAGLAYAICDMALNPPPELTPADVAKFYQQALAAADRAVAIAPELASGHAARSAVLSNGFHDFNQASAEAARAVALEPGNAGVLGYYAQLASDLGHMSDAVAAAQHAAVLDPLRPDVWDNLAYVLIAAHQYEAALQASRHGATLRGGAIPAGANDVLVRIYLLQGNPRAALAICPNSTSAWRGVCQTIALHALGQLAAAQSALNQFMATTGGQSTYNYVQIYAQWGDTGRALDWLDKAAATHDQVLETMKSDPLVDPLRASPRFQAVLRGMNFPP
jgi:tetratricopeptide (TPR) repeat protein